MHPFHHRPRNHPLPQHAQKARRQEAIGGSRQITAHGRPEIRAGPNEIIGLSQHDPRAFAIEAEATLHQWRDFERVGWIVRRRVRDWKDADGRRNTLAQDHENDRAGTVLGAFLTSGAGLSVS